jgi:hypothetical protein
MESGGGGANDARAAIAAGRERLVRDVCDLHPELFAAGAGGDGGRYRHRVPGVGSDGSGDVGFSIARTARALLRSMRHLRAWRRRGSEATIGDRRVWMVDGSGQTLALAGIFRPKLIVSRNIVETLPADQLAAALRHERAHADAWDNSKRLLMLLAPNLTLRSQVERAWARFAEWSADDRAAEGDANRSVSLAAALVSVARMGSSSVPPLGHCADGEFGGFAGESGTAAPGTQ